MRGKVRTIFQVVVGIVLVVSICAAEGSAQKRKRRARKAKPVAPRPVITNPTIAAPGTSEGDATGDVRIISTAEEGAEGSTTGESVQPKKPKTATPTAEPNIQQTITTLSNQVNKLNDKLTQMQEDDRYQIEMERLTRAEQRAEQVRSQLIDVQSKIADFEAKLDQIEYALKPENIERSTQTGGSVHPEEAREARKRQLENEKGRVQAQLKILESSKARLEVSVTNADAEVDLLRAKMNERRLQMEATPTETRPRKPDPN
jgi:chromosome segregation ATPase